MDTKACGGLGQVRLGYVRLDQARLGSMTLSQDRLGQVKSGKRVFKDLFVNAKKAKKAIGTYAIGSQNVSQTKLRLSMFFSHSFRHSDFCSSDELKDTDF